ncbi:MAG: YraN family protein [Balneolales bacterium]|nr:YraN family protein [Balneolales bacterium]
MISTQDKGRWAEDEACAFLENLGHTILDRNYRFMKAEVDIVAFIPNEIVFVEVRSLEKSLFGRPEETISEKKKQLLYEGAEAWLYERKMDGARIRFDVISIIVEHGVAKPEITHFRNAFWM